MHRVAMVEPEAEGVLKMQDSLHPIALRQTHETVTQEHLPQTAGKQQVSARLPEKAASQEHQPYLKRSKKLHQTLLDVSFELEILMNYKLLLPKQDDTVLGSSEEKASLVDQSENGTEFLRAISQPNPLRPQMMRKHTGVPSANNMRVLQAPGHRRALKKASLSEMFQKVHISRMPEEEVKHTPRCHSARSYKSDIRKQKHWNDSNWSERSVATEQDPGSGNRRMGHRYRALAYRRANARSKRSQTVPLPRYPQRLGGHRYAKSHSVASPFKQK